MSEITTEVVTYAEGGHDPAKPDGNVASRRTVLLSSREVAGEVILERAKAALKDNADFLALTTPTAAQNAAQIKRLTRECSAIIRLLLQDFDDASDT